MQDLMCRNGAWERSLCLKYRFGRAVGTEMVTEAVGVEITQGDCVALKETKTLGNINNFRHKKRNLRRLTRKESKG